MSFVKRDGGSCGGKNSDMIHESRKAIGCCKVLRNVVLMPRPSADEVTLEEMNDRQH